MKNTHKQCFNTEKDTCIKLEEVTITKNTSWFHLSPHEKSWPKTIRHQTVKETNPHVRVLPQLVYTERRFRKFMLFAASLRQAILGPFWQGPPVFPKDMSWKVCLMFYYTITSDC